MTSINELKELIEFFSLFEIVELDDKFIISVPDKYKKRDEKCISRWEVEKKEFDDICSKMDEYSKTDERKIKETSLYNAHTYESLLSLRNNSRFFLSRQVEEQRTLSDFDNEISYEITRASNHFVFFILKQLKELNTSSTLRMNIDFRVRNNDNESDFFKMFSFLTRFITLKINSSKEMKIRTYETIATSFVFTLSYNLGMSIIELKSLDEFSMPQREHGKRRIKFDEMTPPRRRYNPDLVYYYQTALSSETASLKFLSFYHIIEYFFEKVYNDDLLISVKGKLTAPDFSYKKDTEITKLIKIIQKKTKTRSETLTLDEKEALKLVLEKYVFLDQLEADLNDYDSKLIDHYKAKEVSFSRGDKIDFNSSDRVVKVANFQPLR